MASRRDELNAYTFARKRLFAAFLQPTPAGTEEGAPRALRAVLPGAVVGALILAGFGAWGMFKPKALKGWDEPKTNVIIGSDSTTRYVVLETNGKAQLHPVLNLSSAKLLLNPDKGKFIKVDEKVLDDRKRCWTKEDPARPHHRHPLRPLPAARRGRRGQGQALGGVRAAGRSRQHGAEGDVRPGRPRDVEGGGYGAAARRPGDVRTGPERGALPRGPQGLQVPHRRSRLAPTLEGLHLRVRQAVAAHPGRQQVRPPAERHRRLAEDAARRHPDHVPPPSGHRRPRRGHRRAERGGGARGHGTQGEDRHRPPALRRTPRQGATRLGLHRRTAPQLARDGPPEPGWTSQGRDAQAFTPEGAEDAFYGDRAWPQDKAVQVSTRSAASPPATRCAAFCAT